MTVDQNLPPFPVSRPHLAQVSASSYRPHGQPGPSTTDSRAGFMRGNGADGDGHADLVAPLSGWPRIFPGI